MQHVLPPAGLCPARKETLNALDDMLHEPYAKTDSQGLSNNSSRSIQTDV
jgi:hypothetical protein